MSSRPSRLALQAFDLLADPARLFRAIPDADALDLLTIAGIGPQSLAEAPRIMSDEAIGGCKDVRRRTIVLLETDDRRSWKILLEAEDVRDLGTRATNRSTDHRRRRQQRLRRGSASSFSHSYWAWLVS